MPLFPLHIWLPEAHVEAPTEGSVILASLLLKLGGYGILRILLPLFPKSSLFFGPNVNVICTLGIIYASLTAIRQIDLKKIVAYSSVAHMSLVVFGIFSYTHQSIHGSIFLMVGHGLVSGGLFFLIGIVYEKFNTRLLDYFGGLVNIMPNYSLIFIVLSLANVSLPGTCNFVGEFLIFLGIFSKYFFFTFWPGISVVLCVIYSMWIVNRKIFGDYNFFCVLPKKEYLGLQKNIINVNFSDIGRIDFFKMAPIIFLTIFLGIYPNFLLVLSENYVLGYILYINWL